MQKIVDFDPKYKFALLCFIYGFVWCLSMAQTLMLGHYYSVGSLVVISALLAVPIGFIFMSITSAFFWIAGRLFKGESNYLNIRSVVAWSNVPSLITIFTWIILIWRYGSDIFITPNPEVASGIVLADIAMVLQAVAGIWSLVILIGGISQIQKFSNWRSFGSVVIVSCLWLLLMFVVIYLLMMSQQARVATFFFAPTFHL